MDNRNSAGIRRIVVVSGCIDQSDKCVSEKLNRSESVSAYSIVFIFSVIKLVQAIKAAKSFVSAAQAIQGADDAVVNSVDDIIESTVDDVSKQTGNYLLRDAKGQVRYTGVGDQSRMKTSLAERRKIIPDLTAEFRPAPNKTIALAREAIYINEYGGAQSMNKLSLLLNKINSPGLKYLNLWV